MKSILYVSRAFLPADVSHSLSIVKMSQAFCDEGYEVTLVGLKLKKDSPNPIDHYDLPGGFQVERITASRGLDWRKMRSWLIDGLRISWRARQLALKKKADIVYSRLTLIELLLLPRHIPIVYEMHSLGFLKYRGWKKDLFKWLLRRRYLRRIIVTSDALEDQLQAKVFGTDIVKARLSAEPPIAPTKDELEAFRISQLQGDEYPLHVGYTGNLDKTGLRGTEIICRVAAQMPNIAFHIVGGADEDVNYWELFYRTLGKKSNLFFYGFRPPSEMPLFLDFFEVVLAPLQFRISGESTNTRGMSPLKIAQYLAYGKVIIASDIPAHREVLESERNALLVPPDDIESWANAIERGLNDPALRARLSSEAAREYEEHFTPARRVSLVLEGL